MDHIGDMQNITSLRQHLQTRSSCAVIFHSFRRDDRPGRVDDRGDARDKRRVGRTIRITVVLPERIFPSGGHAA